MNIKFRVWNNMAKSFVKDSSGVCIFNPWTWGTYCQELGWKTSDSLIFQLFTGLTEYDGENHGREIYEGDIIVFAGRWDKHGKCLPPDNEPYQVLWLSAGIVAYKINHRSWLSFPEHNDIVGIGHTSNKIIGNIFENPELLKNKYKDF